jgi:uncharacterized protein (DUF488 family)
MTTIYTVGHSNHEIDDFLALLHRHGVELLIDVRSTPYSRYVPQANRESLARDLETNGIAYRWMGDLLAQAATRCTVIMCSEGDHRHCHRYKLITPALLELGARVLHIQPDGSVVDEKEEPRQLTLL